MSTQRKICKATNARGLPCKRIAHENGYCSYHDPERSEEQKAKRKEIALKAAKARAEQSGTAPKDFEPKERTPITQLYDPEDLRDPEKLTAFLTEVTLRVADNEISHAAGQAISAIARQIRLTEDWLKARGQKVEHDADKMTPLEFARLAQEEVAEMSGGTIRLIIEQTRPKLVKKG